MSEGGPHIVRMARWRLAVWFALVACPPIFFLVWILVQGRYADLFGIVILGAAVPIPVLLTFRAREIGQDGVRIRDWPQLGRMRGWRRVEWTGVEEVLLVGEPIQRIVVLRNDKMLFNESIGDLADDSRRGLADAFRQHARVRTLTWDAFKLEWTRRKAIARQAHGMGH